MNKTAFLFCGGGAQFPGMMKELYDNVAASHEIFERADAAAGMDISRTCFCGTAEELGRTEVMIPAVFTADMAAFAALQSAGVVPEAVSGFSLGEWAAVTAAGVLSFEEALQLVCLRSRFMDEAAPPQSGMAVVMGKPFEEVSSLCGEIETAQVFPANDNCPGQVTVSGTEAGLCELERLAKERQIVFRRIPVNVPSHCPLMAPAERALGEVLADVTFSEPAFPVVSNVTARPETDPETIRQNLIVQLVSPVRFRESVLYMAELGVNSFLEVGPGGTLSGFVRRCMKKSGMEATSVNVGNLEGLEAAKALRNR